MANNCLETTELVDDKYFYYLVKYLNESLKIFHDFVTMTGKNKILGIVDCGHRHV